MALTILIVSKCSNPLQFKSNTPRRIELIGLMSIASCAHIAWLMPAANTRA